MTIGGDERCTSPVHVHISDDTPVHVHVKKGALRSKSPTTKLDVQDRVSPGKGQSTNLNRSTAMSRSRSPVPWVPPPGKCARNNKLAWQGPTHRLELTGNPGRKDQRADLSTDDESVVTHKIRQYENKIDSLMTEMGTLKNEVCPAEMGTLKNEVELQRTFREMDRKEEMLDASRDALLKQEQELEECRQELTATERENELLRKSMDRLHDGDHTRPEMDRAGSEREELMRRLVEAEMDGQAAAKQSAALRDSLRRVTGTRHISQTDSQMVCKQRELLTEKLARFETTNHCVRKLLRSAQREEGNSMKLDQQREILLKKLSESDGIIEGLRLDVMDRDRRATESHLELEAQVDANKNLANIQTSMDSTRAHLQKQLRQKEADCNRMAVQIRSIESQLAQEKIDNDHLQELLATAKDKAEKDKEALKKATRVQKQRASRSEDAVEQLNSQLMERENLVADLRNQTDTFQSRLEKLCKEKTQALNENAVLRSRINDVESALADCELRTTQHIDQMQSRLQEKSALANDYKSEVDRLKCNFSSIEDKFSQAEGEVTTLRSSLRQYENLVDEYRGQVNKSRQEADEVMIELEEQQKDSARHQRESELELDRVRTQLQKRLGDLEPLPEMLKTTEMQLCDANEKNSQADRRYHEQSGLLTEQVSKVESLSQKLEVTSEKYRLCEESSREQEHKIERLERRAQDLQDDNQDLTSSVVKRDDMLHQHNDIAFPREVLIEEKSRENSSLHRQLEQSLTEARRQADQTRDKASSKERAGHSKMLDLESQLAQLRSELAKMRREKEEAERRYNSRLYDLKDRLEQSHSTNRSMQNYVQFLKQSYANVFGDSASSPLADNLHTSSCQPFRSRYQ